MRSVSMPLLLLCVSSMAGTLHSPSLGKKQYPFTCHPARPLNESQTATQATSDESCHHRLASNNTPVTTVVRTRDRIKILSFNARSLRNKIDELRCIVMAENIDVIAVTETFIDTVHNDLLYEYSIE